MDMPSGDIATIPLEMNAGLHEPATISPPRHKTASLGRSRDLALRGRRAPDLFRESSRLGPGPPSRWLTGCAAREGSRARCKIWQTSRLARSGGGMYGSTVFPLAWLPVPNARKHKGFHSPTSRPNPNAIPFLDA